ncbi:hybrid sensor histidine kinase/response regulator [Heliophilum fasciatum]|uniref:Circadian input-output histidine kinase CikA n=1 Tax=Heliophilum fasciatum TaxID=35700 RepID=A0A4R2RYD2_9FIRM|nr:hybrid sensor histidine kinase/response regulator [Heliophilum fasciatum]MCW2276940.1 nitrogen fixation negative regulator NifL [Heliophilum fasciatum]TCP68534.1 nitrogen fixation negative regulator NifL [Heliophilum fasciatum]
MKPIKIRTGLFTGMSMTVFIVIVIFTLAVNQLIINRAIEHVADSELRQYAAETDNHVQEFVSTVERQLLIAQELAAKGVWGDGELTTFVRAVMPVLRQNQSLSAMIFADEDSREVVLYKDDIGWRAGNSFPAERPGWIGWSYWDREGNLVQQQEDKTTYDCRTRPWFIGAMGLPAGKVFWTAPYMFFTKPEPGITAALHYVDANGKRRVIAMDVSLRDLSGITRPVLIGERGYVAIFDQDGNVLGLPGVPFSITPSGRGPALPTLERLGVPSLQAGFTRWSEAGGSFDQLLHYKSGDEGWLTMMRPVTVGGKRFVVGVFAPEREFAHDRQNWHLALGLLLMTVLGLSFVLSNELSRRLSRPLGQLLEQSERIGRLDFTPNPVAKTGWAEINRLADANEEMRRLLQQTTEYLEEQVRSRTVELQKLSQAVEQSPVTVVITDPEGTIEYVNPNFCKVTGYTPEEAIGENPRFLKSGLTPPERFTDLWMTIKAGRPWHGEMVNKKKDGRHYWQNLVVAPIKNEAGEITHFVAIQEDISELRKAQKELSDQLAFTAKLLDDIPNPIFYRDADARFLGCNKAYEAAFGLSRDMMIGKSIDETPHFPDLHRDEYKEQAERVIREGSLFHRAMRMHFADGHVHDVLFWISGFHLSDGTPGGLTGIVVDISDLKEKEEKLRQAQMVAEEATQAKSMFLANMSHEIRTPMNAVIGMAYLAMKTDLTAKQRDYVEKIYNAGTSLLQIINDILDFSKIEAQNLALEQIDFSLTDVLNGVVDVNSSKAYDKGLEFIYHIPPDLPISLVGDPLRLGQVLTNLVSNALKFTEKGYVSIDVQLLQQIGNKVQLKFKVSDTGIGLTEEQAHKLFQPFTQADGSTTRKHGGTGLGLSICKRLVEMMEGSIWVTSEPRVGSQFSFTAWFGLAEMQQTQQRLMPERLQGLHLLVADDNPAALEIVAEYLRSMQFRVDVAVNGEEAIAAVRRCDGSDPYAVVFMDWQMPGMNGIQAAKLLKKDTDLTTIPAIVMISAFDRDELRHHAKQACLEGVLIKPIGYSLLHDTIVQVLVPTQEVCAVVQPLQEQNYGLAGGRVLVAEDNEVNQQIVIELLESQGMQVDMVNNGQEALEKIKSVAGSGTYDVVLLDLEMPIMDGFEAARAIRRLEPDLPLIALTAWAMASERERCFEAGMNLHVAKPIDPELLFTTLAQFVQPKNEGTVPLAPTPVVPTGEVRGAERTIGSLPGIQVDDGLRRVAGNTTLYGKLLRKFVENHQDGAERLALALDDRDHSTALSLAHSIKGVAGNLGAVELSAAAAAIEQILKYGKEEDVEQLPPLLVLFASKLAQVVAGIQGHFAGEGLGDGPGDETPVGLGLAASLGAHPVEAPTPGDRSVLAPQVEQLKTLLQDFDSEAVDFFDSVRSLWKTHYDHDQIEKLDKALKTFQFDQALELLERMDEEGEPL